MRIAVSVVHRWTGWLLGIWLMLISLSGALLLFKNDLLRWQYPILASAPSTAPTSAAIWGAQLNALQQQSQFRYVKFPDHDAHWLEAVTFANQRYYYSAKQQLLLVREPRGDWIDWLYDFHLHLLAGDTGHQVIGYIGLLVVLLIISGIIQWWPRHFSWRVIKLPLHRFNTRALRQWHAVIGLLFAPLILLTALTGSMMVFHQPVKAALGWAFSDTVTALPKQTAGTLATELTNWPQALTLAGQHWPAAQLRLATLRPDIDSPITLRAKAADEWHPNGRGIMQIDAAANQVIYAMPANELGQGEQIRNTFYPLHIAAIGGAPYRWTLFLSGLIPVILLILGLSYSVHSRRSRQMRQR